MSTAPLTPIALDHVGIAAGDGRAPLCDLLDSAMRSPVDMPSGVTVARFGPAAAMELVWPRADHSPVSRFLERHGPGLHHIALSVDEPLTTVQQRLTAAGIRLTGEIVPSSDGRPSLFIHPSSTGGVLIELVEGQR